MGDRIYDGEVAKYNKNAKRDSSQQGIEYSAISLVVSLLLMISQILIKDVFE
jgi:hypothetical protein